MRLIDRWRSDTNVLSDKSQKVKSKHNEIILNRMYAGDYLKSDNNIGHEIINLFQADDVNTDKCEKGKYFIYINPYGSISSSHNDKVRIVLMVRWYGEHILEVLAKTEGYLKQWVYEKYSKAKKGDEKYRQERKKIHDEHVEKLKQANVTYGGVSLEDIFKYNQDNDIAYYVTFEAEKIIKVKEPIYLVDGNYQEQVGEKVNKEKIVKLEDLNNFSKQSLKMYVSQDKHSKSYHTLAEIINNPKLWGEAVGQVKDTDQQEDSENDNIFKIIKKEYDELVVSNMLAYYFEKGNLFKDFAKEVLGIEDISDSVKIYREKSVKTDEGKGFIDLLIEDKTNRKVIVIENKIKSKINGIAKHHDINDEKIKSQLDVYYKWVKKNNDYKGFEQKFFIFAPNYNKLDVDKYFSSDGEAKYEKIWYFKINKWFKNQREKYKDNYYEDFLALLEKHSQPTEDFEKEIQRRFNKIINEMN